MPDFREMYARARYGVLLRCAKPRRPRSRAFLRGTRARDGYFCEIIEIAHNSEGDGGRSSGEGGCEESPEFLIAL